MASSSDGSRAVFPGELDDAGELPLPGVSPSGDVTVGDLEALRLIEGFSAGERLGCSSLLLVEPSGDL